MAPALIRIEDLTLAYGHGETSLTAVDSVSFEIQRGEAFGLIGESGCGKSSLAYTLLGYRHPGSRVHGGGVWYDGRDLLTLERRPLAKLRGNRISLVPQNPTTAFNPGMSVGAQIAEVSIQHGIADTRKAALEQVVDLFSRVGLANASALTGRYPHQLSGGQQQRAAIAMALVCSPDIVVLDEPTTGLDVTTQEQVVEMLLGLREQRSMAMLYVTHDLALLSEIADRIGVMYAGRLLEIAPTADLYARPRHPYTKGLIASTPRLGLDRRSPGPPLRGLLRREQLPPGCGFYPRCDFADAGCARTRQVLESDATGHEVACQRWRAIPSSHAFKGKEESSYGHVRVRDSEPLLRVDALTLAYGAPGRGLRRLLSRPRRPVVSNVSFNIARSECFALVGESGSGKSTIARALCGLLEPRAGGISLQGEPLPRLLATRSQELRRTLQYIFQNPDASLNPRMRIAGILARPLAMFFDLDRGAIGERIEKALHEVRLEASYARRFPGELSGGERQRVAIARALVAQPALLLCDEILSALDVSVQANILQLLRRLRRETKVAILFISHDLAVVRGLADRVGVLFGGELCEIGGVDALFSPPFHPYTCSLLVAVPGGHRNGARSRLEPHRQRPIPDRRQWGSGCVFYERCPLRIDGLCDQVEPPWHTTDDGLRIRCHVEPATLASLTAGASIR
ncbi:MAG: ABC transporter ATP-binding protein [Gammaproteobacteria bacterium]